MQHNSELECTRLKLTGERLLEQEQQMSSKLQRGRPQARTSEQQAVEQRDNTDGVQATGVKEFGSRELWSGKTMLSVHVLAKQEKLWSRELRREGSIFLFHPYTWVHSVTFPCT